MLARGGGGVGAHRDEAVGDGGGEVGGGGAVGGEPGAGGFSCDGRWEGGEGCRGEGGGEGGADAAEPGTVGEAGLAEVEEGWRKVGVLLEEVADGVAAVLVDGVGGVFAPGEV